MPDLVVHECGLFFPATRVERTYELQLEHFASALFSGYRWYDFKVRVDSEEGVMFPDAALVARDYSHWFVVEVELARHGWADHIRPQLRRMIQGRYCSRHRDHLKAHAASGSDPSLLDELDIYGPEFLVIIDTHLPELRTWCQAHSVRCMEAIPFLADSNDLLLCLNGDRPTAPRGARNEIVAEAELKTGDATVVCFRYTYATRFTETVREFYIRVGDATVKGVNLLEQPIGYLAMSEEDFRSRMGQGHRYSVIRELGGGLEVRSCE